MADVAPPFGISRSARTPVAEVPHSATALDEVRRHPATRRAIEAILAATREGLQEAAVPASLEVTAYQDPESPPPAALCLEVTIPDSGREAMFRLWHDLARRAEQVIRRHAPPNRIWVAVHRRRLSRALEAIP